MSYNQRAGEMSRSLMTRLGEPVAYAGKTITALVDMSVATVGDYGQVMDYRTQITLATADVPALKKGENITAGARVFTVDAIDSADDQFITAWVR